jgi:sulfite exporter TauE/SafE
VAVYAFLGAAVGLIGSLLGLGDHLGRWSGIISVVLGLGVILLGLAYLGWFPLRGLEGSGDWLTRAMGWALQRRRWASLLLGGLNGVLPCGLVYSSLLIAASSGGPLPGALGMLAFGAGTVPALLVIGLGVGSLGTGVRHAMARVAGGLIVVVGLQLMLRGGAAMGVLPHLRVAGVMIW